MDHQTILMIDRCHNFKLGHFFNLKDLNSRLFMFFVKCLQNSNKNNCFIMSFLPNITLVLDVWELLSHEGTDGGASIR